MIIAGLLLTLTILEHFQALNSIEENQINELENYDFSRKKRDDDDDDSVQKDTPTQWKGKFRDESEESWPCHKFYKTEETPFIAIILLKTSGRFLCMGSIIDRNHVLSAKKCFERTDPADLLVLVGYYKAYWGRNSQVLKVEKFVRHEGHVLMLRLSEKMTFTNYVQPVKLPSSATRESSLTESFPPPYKMPGFTIDKYHLPGEFLPREKRYIIKENLIMNEEECTSSFPKLLTIADELFCTIGNTSFCWGTRGAPVLKWVIDAHYLLVGVVVADNCTAHSKGPYMAVRTDTFTEWVRGNSFHGRDAG